MALQHIASQKIEGNPWMSKMEGQIQHPQMLGKPSPFQSKESLSMWIVSTVITLLSHSFLRNQQTPWKTSDNFTKSSHSGCNLPSAFMTCWKQQKRPTLPGFKKNTLRIFPKQKKVSPSLQTNGILDRKKRGESTLMSGFQASKRCTTKRDSRQKPRREVPVVKCNHRYPLVFPNIAGWNMPIFNRKYIDSLRVHFPASYVRWSRSVFWTWEVSPCHRWVQQLLALLTHSRVP